jgi:hypothetical protein
MSSVPAVSDITSRNALVAALREELSKRAGGRSICALAAEQGIFCGGFQRFTDEELRQRLPWLIRNRPKADRTEIERLGDAWQQGRQELRAGAISCDVQTAEHDLCNGWDDFSNEDLATFYRELTGRKVRVDDNAPRL